MCRALRGQKVRSPSIESSAGVSVSPAARAITTPMATLGPVVLKSPSSAKAMVESPTTTVPALEAMVSPTVRTVSGTALAARCSSAISSRKRLMRNRQ